MGLQPLKQWLFVSNRDAWKKKNITNVRVEAVNLRSLQRELHGALAYIDITNSHMDYGIPTVNGLAFLSGEHKEEAFQELIKIIKNR